jgi:BMFP domain-containing protein YqiC
MSKLLWKILLFSPAVLSATLMLFAGTVRAADGSSQLVGDSQPTTNVTQPQSAEAQTQKTQSIASAAAPLAPTAKEPVSSTADNQTAAKLEVPAQVAVNPNQLNLTAPENTVTAPISVTPAAPKVAQTAPTPAETNVLDQINRYNREGNSTSQDQVTNVSQLRDVSPGDWAYEALRSLVERYGCIAGYPDGTYKGRQALTRYEFAAGLNACLNQVERLIASSTADFVRRSDLETLQRLVNEFRTELTTLGARVDKLEGRVAFLEDHQFSTTTKLQGEAIFAITDEFGQAFENNTVFQDRVRLRLNTSFTGKDLLVTRLAAGNAQSFRKVGGPLNSVAGGSGEGTQTFEIGEEGNNRVNLDWLGYYFNFGSSKVYVAATGGAHSDYVPTLNPYFDDGDGGNGALSTFATQNPIYRIGGGAGAAISLGVGPLQSILGPSTLTLGYLAGPSANDPSEKNGLFDGNFAALGQLNFNLGDRIGIGATYVHSYKTTGTDIFNFGNGSTGDNGRVVGSLLANRPSRVLGLGNGVPTVTNSYGGEAAFRFTDKISISGFATYTQAILLGRGRGDIWTYGGGLAFSDFGKKGNVLGLFAGVEPTLRGVTPGLRPASGFSRDNSWHFEGFYKYQLTDNISVTPGVIWLTAPGQRDANTDAIIGTLRTTFTF